MYHLILILLIGVLSWLSWNLVRYSPRSLSMLLPRKLTLSIGVFMMFVGLFSAFFSSFAMRDAPGMLASLVLVYMGLWWTLATSAGARGTYADDVFLRRVFTMMGMLMVFLVSSLYIADARLVATLNLAMVAGGLWVTTNFFSFLDRGR
ncbi:MAG TPA: hypothetical protein VI759_09075 [Dehalococcoidia bacterium]|nr:hypothetical protein [Dehalococcoidia bacterium]